MVQRNTDSIRLWFCPVIAPEPYFMTNRQNPIETNLSFRKFLPPPKQPEKRHQRQRAEHRVSACVHNSSNRYGEHDSQDDRIPVIAHYYDSVNMSRVSCAPG